MRKVFTASFVPLFLIVFAFISVDTSSMDGNELRLAIGETNVEILISMHLSLSSETETCYILLPFVVDRKTASFPSTTVCTKEAIENRYTIFSLIVPPNISRIEVSGLTLMDRLVARSGEWCKIRISFSYEEAPFLIKELMSKENTLSSFETIEIALPPFVDTTELMESPASSSSDQTRSYDMKDIQSLANGILTVTYPVSALYWPYQMVFGAIFAFIPSIGLVMKVQPDREKKTRFLFLIPLTIVYLWACFSSIMLLLNGPTWDFLSNHYGGTMVIAVAMSTWLRRIFGKLPIERDRSNSSEQNQPPAIDSQDQTTTSSENNTS